MNRILTLATLCLALSLGAVAVAAEAEVPVHKTARIAPVGARALIGVVVPSNADAGLVLGAAVNLGTVWKPWMHLSLGVTRWSTDVDAAAFGNRAGTLRDTKMFTNVGLEFWKFAGVQGYLDLGFGAHFLDMTLPADPVLADVVSGTNFGAEVAYRLASTQGAVRISAEARKEFVNDAGNWSFMVGIGSRWGEGAAERIGEK